MELFANLGLWVLGVAVSAGGWLVNMLFGKLKDNENRHDELRDQFEQHRLHVAQNYTPRVYIENMENRLVAYLVRIEDKLDNKADK